MTLLTEEKKLAICAAIRAVGGENYQPAQIIGSVREDAGGLREPIDDLVDMEQSYGGHSE